MRLVRKVAPWLVTLMVFAGLGVTWMVLDMGAYRVNSGSMEPTLPKGSVVLTYKSDDLDRRDIITYRKEGGGVVTHTFIGRAKDGSLMTHGDANPVADNHQPPLTMQDVKGELLVAVTPLRAIAALLFVAAIVIVTMLPTKPSRKSQASLPASEPASIPA